MGMKTIGRFVYDNSTVTNLAANENIPLPTSTISTNCISNDGTTITINRSGVYEILANFTFEATATGVQETQMYRNGNAVPGAHAISTAATIGDYISQELNGVITVPRNAPTASINFKAIDATSIRIANILVIKIA